MMSRRAKELEANATRLSSQLRDLYGPLHSIVVATESAYAAMVTMHMANHASSPDELTDAKSTVARWHKLIQDDRTEEAVHYRRWVVGVLQPLNERAFELIIRHADLLDTPFLPATLRQYMAHTCAWRVILKMWDAGDYSMIRCAVAYPKDLRKFVSAEFKRLKRRQFQNLGEKASAGLPGWLSVLYSDHADYDEKVEGVDFKEDMTPEHLMQSTELHPNSGTASGDERTMPPPQEDQLQDSESMLAGLWDRVPFRTATRSKL